jgi:hypothetical protein
MKIERFTRQTISASHCVVLSATARWPMPSDEQGREYRIVPLDGRGYQEQVQSSES